MSDITERLRLVIREVRRKPTPLSEFIPLLADSVNEIERLRNALAELVAADDALERTNGIVPMLAANDRWRAAQAQARLVLDAAHNK